MESGTGMLMDFTAAAILLLSTILGARKGFAMTVASFMQWFVCLFLGFVFCGAAKDILIDYTELDEAVHASILSHIETSLEESSAYQALPDLFSSWIGTGGDSLTSATAESVTSALMTVIAFLTVVLGIKIIGFLVSRLFSRRYNDGVTGFIDGFFGFLFGLARGLILVLVFFALLVPVLSMLLPDLAESAVTAMKDSYFAGLFYDENVLLILVRDIFA